VRVARIMSALEAQRERNNAAKAVLAVTAMQMLELEQYGVYQILEKKREADGFDASLATASYWFRSLAGAMGPKIAEPTENQVDMMIEVLRSIASPIGGWTGESAKFNPPAVARGQRGTAAALAAAVNPPSEEERADVVNVLSALQGLLPGERTALTRAYGPATPPPKAAVGSVATVPTSAPAKAAAAAAFYGAGVTVAASQRPTTVRVVSLGMRPTEKMLAQFKPNAESGVTAQGINPLPPWVELIDAKTGGRVVAGVTGRRDSVMDFCSIIMCMLLAFGSAHKFQARVPAREYARDSDDTAEPAFEHRGWLRYVDEATGAESFLGVMLTRAAAFHVIDTVLDVLSPRLGLRYDSTVT
jgi:hypothetical protein